MTRAHNWKDLAGRRYGLLLVEAYVVLKSGRAIWLCKCDCGNDHVATANHLLRNNLRSCGCATGAHIAQAKYVYGSHRNPLYPIWSAMIQRCHSRKNHAFRNYGARGIKVCRRWRIGTKAKHPFDCFVADIGPRPPGKTLERINNDRGYSPRNCRWATRAEQAFNRRNTRFIVYRGERRSLADWCARLDLRYGMTMTRLDKGWPPEKAFTHPRRITASSQPRESA